MLSAKLASAKDSLRFSVGAACTWGPLTVAEQHLSCQKGIIPPPVTLPVVDG